MGFEPDPESVVDRHGSWTLAVNRNQNLLGKSILVLGRPCTAVTDLTPSEWAELHAGMGQAATALASLYEPDQFNYAFLMNVDAQVHLHIIPRYQTPRTWQGEEFSDPNWGRSFGHEVQLLEPDQIRTMAREIRSALQQTDAD
ncbi:MAG: hypothetical protein GY701_16435 [Sulfitobacter sp.]|nr:hypothetical protein [Sulfitobacter sp.]